MSGDLDLYYEALYNEEKVLRIAIMDDDELQNHCSFCKPDCQCIACGELKARDLRRRKRDERT